MHITRGVNPMKASNPRSQSAALFSSIFLVASCCTAQTVTHVIGFTVKTSLGNPTMAPTQGRNAELYGTSFDPQSTSGSIFSSTTTGAANVLFAFNYTNGSNPLAGRRPHRGYYYGTTSGGGTFSVTAFSFESAQGEPIRSCITFPVQTEPDLWQLPSKERTGASTARPVATREYFGEPFTSSFRALQSSTQFDAAHGKKRGSVARSIIERQPVPRS